MASEVSIKGAKKAGKIKISHSISKKEKKKDQWQSN